MKLIANQETWLKKDSFQDAEDLGEDKRFKILKGQTLDYKARKESSNPRYDVVTFTTGYGSKNYNTWYIFRDHFQKDKNSLEGEGILTKAGGRTDRGEQQYILTVGGTKISVGSGQPNTSPVFPTEDYPGSMNPIPEGRYIVGDPCVNMQYDDPYDGIGPYWIPLIPMSNIGVRDGFLFHLDYNRSVGYIGTAGCVYPFVDDDYWVIEKLVKSGKLRTLTVDYGFGTIN
jgi:hypothetical protein